MPTFFCRSGDRQQAALGNLPNQDDSVLVPHLHVVTNLHVVVVVVVVVVVAIVEKLCLKLLRCEQGDDGNYGSTAVQDVKGSPEHE